MRIVALIALVAAVLGCAPRHAVEPDGSGSPFPLRLASHTIPDDPEAFRALCERLAAMGHSAIVLDVAPARAVFLDSFDPDLMPEGSAARARTQSNRERLAWELEVAISCGLMPVVSGDALEFPAEVLSRPWSPEITVAGTDPSAPRLHAAVAPMIFDVESERLWALHRTIFEELLRDFPSIGAVMIRSGESGAHRTGGAYVGHGVYPQFISRNRLAAMGVDFEARMARLISETASIVCPSGRLLIHRTWDTEDDLFHASPEVFRAVMAQVEPHENLILSTKFTAVDFFSHAAPNPTLGIGPWRRMVEFQIAREYEGKGAFPNWLGDLAAEAFLRARDQGVEGVWIWHTGGGQGGPRPAESVWNDMNSKAVTRLMMNPDLDPLDLLTEWTRRTICGCALHTMPAALRRTHDTVRALRHFGVYGEEPRPRKTPADTWMRDDRIRGDRWLARVWAEHADRVDEMIEEKERALHQTHLLELMITRFLRNQPHARFIGESLEHHTALAEVIVPFVRAYFRYRQWQESGDPELRAEIAQQLERWEEAWEHCQTLAPDGFPATLHRDDGMIETVERIRDRLSRPRDLALVWEVSRLWPNPEHTGFDRAHGPEIGEPCDWRPIPGGFVRDGLVDLDDLFAPENDWVLAYARTAVEAERETPCHLRLGSDDGIKVWVNGALVHALDARRPVVEDEDVMEITLRPGANEILLKITEGILGWGFCLRLTDGEGMPVSGVTSLNP
jgi:hypothetical protein